MPQDNNRKTKLSSLILRCGEAEPPFLKALGKAAFKELNVLKQTSETLNDYIGRLFPFESIRKMLYRSFLLEKTRGLLMDSLDGMEAALLHLTETCDESNFNFSRDTIQRYLNAYIQVMHCLLVFSPELKQGNEWQKFLTLILGLGCEFVPRGDRDVGIMTPFAPNYMSAAYKISREERNLNSLLSEETYEQKRRIYQEILHTRIVQYMNWYIVAPSERGSQLCRVRLRPYARDFREWNRLSLPIVPLSLSDNYEGVSELRLFEKIMYELERRPCTEEALNCPFNVTLVGEIDWKAFVRLCQMLEGWMGKRPERIGSNTGKAYSFHFTIVTGNTFPAATASQTELPGNVDFDAESFRYQPVFQDAEAFAKLVDQSDLLFFLDCREQYDGPQAVPYSGLNAFLQQSAELVEIIKFRKGVHLPDSFFFKVQSLLNGAAYGDGTPALLKKSARIHLMDFLEGRLMVPRHGTAKTIRTAYVYFSDLDAAENLYWQEDHFIRVERYDGKQMAILRYGEKIDEELQNAETDAERVIVFNLWQFIKYTSLHRLDDLLEYFGLGRADTYQNLYVLSEILIGIDYKDWPQSLEVSYWLDEQLGLGSGFRDKLEEYLQKIIAPCLIKQRVRDQFLQYLQTCIGSFLYSDAKNVDDMLFLHLFTKNRGFQRRNDIIRENQAITGCVCNRKKYSGKRFYQEVIDDYDVPSQFFPNQYRKLEIMRKNGELKPDEVFFKIKKACESNHYRESYLYQNCKEMLE